MNNSASNRNVIGVLSMVFAVAALGEYSAALGSCPDFSKLWEEDLREEGFGTETPEQISEATKSQSRIVRHAALQLLTLRVGSKAAAQLKNGLGDESLRIRMAAAHLLGTFGDKSGLDRMREDFKRLIPPDGLKEGPADVRDPNKWTMHEALEVSLVLAELGDVRGYKLAARAARESPMAANRSDAVRALAQMPKADVNETVSLGAVSVLCSVAESETKRTVFMDVVMAAKTIGGEKGIRILEKAEKSPHQSAQDIRVVKYVLKKLTGKTKARQP